MLMIILLAFSRDPALNPSTHQFLSDPAIVVVCPTTALQEDQVSDFLQ